MREKFSQKKLEVIEVGWQNEESYWARLNYFQMFLLHSSMFVCWSIFVVVVVVVVFVTQDCRLMGYNAFQTLFPALYFQSLFSNNFRHFSDPCFSYDKWSLRFYSCFQSTKSTLLLHKGSILQDVNYLAFWHSSCFGQNGQHLH